MTDNTSPTPRIQSLTLRSLVSLSQRQLCCLQRMRAQVDQGHVQREHQGQQEDLQHDDQGRPANQSTCSLREFGFLSSPLGASKSDDPLLLFRSLSPRHPLLPHEAWSAPMPAATDTVLSSGSVCICSLRLDMLSPDMLRSLSFRRVADPSQDRTTRPGSESAARMLPSLRSPDLWP